MGVYLWLPFPPFWAPPCSCDIELFVVECFIFLNESFRGGNLECAGVDNNDYNGLPPLSSTEV